MSKVASNLKSVYQLFIEEVRKGEPDVDVLESLIDRLPKEDIDRIIILNLDNKKLYKLPNNIGNLTNLQLFSCSGNQISEIPDSIGNFTNLQILLIYDNQISEIPSSIGNLTNLEYFTYSNNKISETSK